MVAVAFIADKPAPLPESPQAHNSTLKVSTSGSQIYTNVTGDNLQQAAPPERSATSSDLNPQQAQPNYCLAGEVPYADGCVPR